jgi:hypothetical protein
MAPVEVSRARGLRIAESRQTRKIRRQSHNETKRDIGPAGG